MKQEVNYSPLNLGGLLSNKVLIPRCARQNRTYIVFLYAQSFRN
jgi:hypothetical protein